MKLRTKRWLISVGTAIPVVATSVAVPLLLLNKKASEGNQAPPTDNGNPLAKGGGHGGSTGRLHHPGFELKEFEYFNKEMPAGFETYRVSRNEDDENDITLDLGAGYGDINQADWHELFGKNPLSGAQAIFAKDDISGSWRATEYDIDFQPHLPLTLDTNHDTSQHFEMIARDKTTHKKKFKGKLTINTHEVHYGPVLKGKPYILRHKPDKTYEIHVRTGDYSNLMQLKRDLLSGIQFSSDIIHPEWSSTIPYPRGGFFGPDEHFLFKEGQLQKTIEYQGLFGTNPSTKDSSIKIIMDAPSSTTIPHTFTGFRFTPEIEFKWHDEDNSLGASVSLATGAIRATGVKPSYEWNGAPEGTRSFGIIVTDQSAADNPVHSLILGIDPAAQAYHSGQTLRQGLGEHNGMTIKTNYFQGILDHFKYQDSNEWLGPWLPKGQTHDYKFELLAFKTNDFRWVRDALFSVTGHAAMHRIIERLETEAIPGTAQSFTKKYVGDLLN